MMAEVEAEMEQACRLADRKIGWRRANPVPGRNKSERCKVLRAHEQAGNQVEKELQIPIKKKMEPCTPSQKSKKRS